MKCKYSLVSIVEKENSERQVEKISEKLNELGDALYFERLDDALDAYGDILATIIIGCVQRTFKMKCKYCKYSIPSDIPGHIKCVYKGKNEKDDFWCMRFERKIKK